MQVRQSNQLKQQHSNYLGYEDKLKNHAFKKQVLISCYFVLEMIQPHFCSVPCSKISYQGRKPLSMNRHPGWSLNKILFSIKKKYLTISMLPTIFCLLVFPFNYFQKKIRSPPDQMAGLGLCGPRLCRNGWNKIIFNYQTHTPCCVLACNRPAFVRQQDPGMT